MSALLAAFLSTFVSVFALGIQSLNVNQRMYVAAAATSVAISSGHLWLYKVMPTATGWDIGGYYAGGIMGITASIWFHARAKAWIAARWPLWKQQVFALFVTPAKPRAPAPCGRCGDEYQFPCWRCDCPRHEA